MAANNGFLVATLHIVVKTLNNIVTSVASFLLPIQSIKTKKRGKSFFILFLIVFKNLARKARETNPLCRVVQSVAFLAFQMPPLVATTRLAPTFTFHGCCGELVPA